MLVPCWTSIYKDCIHDRRILHDSLKAFLPVTRKAKAVFLIEPVKGSY